ncbi:MAG: glycosyl hydrolase [Bacteroidota bacterium]
MNFQSTFVLLFSVLLCNLASAQKFEPENGKCLVFIGQDLGAVGGLDAYNAGYSDHFEIPAGVTVYSNVSPGTESFGYFNKGLDGLKKKANWGAGDCWAQLYTEDSTYQNSAIAIGLSLVDHEKKVAKGTHDRMIEALAQWIKAADRPVFLRIGYEFDGHEWNHYSKRHFLKAWQRIHSIFADRKVDNVAFVWQSKGTGSNQEVLEAWYPGDDLVDWVGYSYFGNPDQEMLTFARNHDKPVFIAEATPVRETDGLFFDTDLKKEGLDKMIWEQWFVGFFQTIENNADVIKAFSYINADWSSQPMWIDNPVFQKVDSRLQVSDYVSQKWKEELKKDRYLNAADAPWHSAIKNKP